ncbi:MAG: transposase [Solirubrobacteraceae bacterium]
MITFATGAIDPGATVHTDGWPAYLALPKHGYEHERTVISARARSLATASFGGKREMESGHLGSASDTAAMPL